MTLKRLISSSASEILLHLSNNAGVVTFNRPSVLNSLTPYMMSTCLSKLQEWEKTRPVVMFKGVGDKAFSPGGDIKVASDKITGPIMFHAQYNVIYFLGKCSIPCISLINGFTMGGALALSVFGRYSVATENTVIAMPETRIGLIPDAGGSYFLSRLQFNLGRYLGLTGERLKGKDVVKAGIATHYVSSDRLKDLEEELSGCTSDKEVLSVLDKYNEPTEDFILAPNIKHINYCFAESTIEGILARLEKVQSDWSLNTISTLYKMSPASLKIALRALQYGRQLDLPDVLRMEYRIVRRAILGHDFPEGVRALLVSKDKNPQWKPKSLAEVSDAFVESYFQKLPEDQELKFYDEKL